MFSMFYTKRNNWFANGIELVWKHVLVPRLLNPSNTFCRTFHQIVIWFFSALYCEINIKPFVIRNIGNVIFHYKGLYKNHLNGKKSTHSSEGMTSKSRSPSTKSNVEVIACFWSCFFTELSLKTPPSSSRRAKASFLQPNHHFPDFLGNGGSPLSIWNLLSLNLRFKREKIQSVLIVSWCIGNVM